MAVWLGISKADLLPAPVVKEGEVIDDRP
jgi:hypothetical protein